MDNLYEKLSRYQASDFYGFHMPGHKRSDLVSFGDPYRIDITEIDGFDNLHHAEGVLKDAQDRAARLYHSEETHFLVNGSTSGLLAAICGCTRRGGRILIARNCHKAVYHAAFLNELQIVSLSPEFDSTYGINCGFIVDNLEKALIENPGIEAIVITSPTYDGVISDVDKIAKIVHKSGIPLIVDEAHGAHLGFHPYFGSSAVEQGADVVIHSLHKTLPSLTQTALIHINGNLVDRENIRRYLSIYQTSSPSYVFMASMDSCVELLENQGGELFEAFARRLQRFRNTAKELEHLYLYRPEDAIALGAAGLDPSKLVITTGDSGLTGKQLSSILRERFHLEMEMDALPYVLALTSIADNDEGFGRLLNALRQIDRECSVESEGRIQRTSLEEKAAIKEKHIFQACPANERRMTLWEAGNRRTETLPAAECDGRISAEYVYLYPPGIPLLTPGEVIGEEILELMKEYQRYGLNLQGPADDSIRTLRVIR